MPTPPPTPPSSMALTFVDPAVRGTHLHLYQRARKLTPDQWGDRPVYRPDYRDAFDAYTHSLADLLADAQVEGLALPQWVWGTRKEVFTVRAAWVLDVAREEMHEAGQRALDRHADGLQAALDAWVAALGGACDSYDVDYTIVIVLDPELQRAEGLVP